MAIWSYIYLISYLVISFEYCTCNHCNEYCHCLNSIVECSGRNLTYIPEIPSQTLVFEMTRTGLKFIGENGFVNISKSSPRKISLIDNQLEDVHPNAFSRFRLKTLRIIKEPKISADTVRRLFDNLNKSQLIYIYLTYNNWTQLPTDIFESFIKSNARFLHFEGNKFTNINCSSFTPIFNLKSLNLGYNGLNRITMFGIPVTIKKLDLRNNIIMKIPNWCEDRKRKISSVPNLETLILDRNVISNLAKEAFVCLPKLLHLSLNGNPMGQIQSNVFAVMPSLQTLQISQVGHPLKEIKDFAFNSSSLTSLRMEQTRFHFDKGTYNPDTIFAYCENLTDLSLSHNYMFNDKSEVENMLLPLRKLKSLDLSSTHLAKIPILQSFANLERFNLDENNIIDWNDKQSDFSHMKSLKKLILSNNNIRIINETSFPKEILSSLKRLDLSGNPFACTCDLLWFTEWIKSTKTDLVAYPWKYKCNQPSPLNQTPLKNYVNAKKTCPPWNPLYTLAIILSISSLIFVAIMVVLTKCLNNIRNMIYLFRVHRKGYMQLYSSSEFEYDAFVVYCDEDREWVNRAFVNRVENEGFKLCIHDRDFEVGEAITENVAKYLEKSRKVIVIMSNEFTKNEWCQWEVDIVHKRLRTYGRDIFLLIMLKPIDSRHMTSKLRSILQCAPCLRYKTGMGGDLFWKAVVAAIRKPIGHPPIALP